MAIFNAMNLDMTGKRALVCGSTQGIGRAAAEALAGLGAELVLVARNEEKLRAVVEALPNASRQTHRYVVADFSDPAGLGQKVSAHLEEHGAINVLINNTGGPAGGPANAAGVEEFSNAFSQHLLCNHTLVQTVLEGMKATGYGRIINVISTSVKQPLNNLGVSNTIRGAVANWAKTLANELGVHNITVNNVLPGATNTARLQSIIANKAAKTGQTEEEVGRAMANAVPMKRVAEPHEVGNAIAFIASPAASYINGINVPVDGGRTACL